MREKKGGRITRQPAASSAHIKAAPVSRWKNRRRCALAGSAIDTIRSDMVVSRRATTGHLPIDIPGDRNSVVALTLRTLSPSFQGAARSGLPNLAANPESILPGSGYGFRVAFATLGPRNDGT